MLALKRAIQRTVTITDRREGFASGKGGASVTEGIQPETFVIRQ